MSLRSTTPRRSPEVVKQQQADARAKRKSRRPAIVDTFCAPELLVIREAVAEEFGMKIVTSRRHGGDFGDQTGCHVVTKSGRASTTNRHRRIAALDADAELEEAAYAA